METNYSNAVSLGNIATEGNMMSESTHTSIREALSSLSDATSRLTQAVIGHEPSEHLKKSMHHAIMAATCSVELMAERMESCSQHQPGPSKAAHGHQGASETGDQAPPPDA